VIAFAVAAALQLVSPTPVPPPSCSTGSSCLQAESAQAAELLEARKSEQLRVEALIFAPLANGASPSACAASISRANSEARLTLAAAIASFCATTNNR